MKKKLTFYVAQCMEFPMLGKVIENIETIEQAIYIHNSIDESLMNGGKGIGFNLESDTLHGGTFGLYENGNIDVETINSIKEFRDNKDIQKAIKELQKYESCLR